MEFMRRTILQLGLVFVLVIASFGTAQAATNAYDAKYVTSISYMNIGTEPANLNLTFYDAGSATTVNYQLIDTSGAARVIPSMASASLSASAVSSLSSTARYGAVVTSNQPLIATMMQVANDSVIRTQPISNGFRASDASGTIVLPSAMKSCFTDKLTTRFSIQNAGASTINDVNIELYWPNGTVATTSGLSGLTLDAGDVQHFDLASITVGSVPAGVTLPSGCAFNGSAVIESATGSLVATAVELSTVNKYANSFEGLPGTTADGALTLYFPSAMCRVNYGDGEQSSSYAVQNLTTSAATIDVDFTYQIRARNGSLGAVQNRTLSLIIPPGAKGSIPGCDASKNTVGNTNNATGSGMPAAAVGSAVVTSNRNVVGLQKVSGGGISAATPAIISGGSKVYTPFVRYTVNCFSARPTAATCRSESRQRTLFAVQNIGGVAAKIKMTLYNYLGEVVGTYTTPSTVAPGAKISINPTSATPVSPGTTAILNEFGYTFVDGNMIYSGSAVFESLDSAGTTPTSSIAVVTRVLSQTPLGQTGDDYNGTP
jgi:hypothetical protein